MRSAPRLAALFALTFAPLLPQALADERSDWVGRQVILKNSDTVFKIGDRVVGNGKIFRVYRVDRVDGDWLWLVHTNLSGWVASADVVPFDKAIDYYAGLINQDPLNSMAYVNRGVCWVARNEYDIAIADFNDAIRLQPNSGGNFVARGYAHEKKGDLRSAYADYTEALRLDPKYARGHYLRGNVSRKQRDYKKAVEDYEAALALDPDLGDALANLAWIRATCVDATYRDGKKAVDAATRACELTDWRAAAPLDILAAAHAEAGNFDEAIKWQNAALDNLPENESNARARFQAHLRNYKEKRPYREEAPEQFRD